jgi:hypothetical protein
MKRWSIAIICAILAIAPVGYLAYHFGFSQSAITDNLELIEFQVEKNTKLEPGSEIEVKACKVIDGYMYGLYLEGNQRIEAHLYVATKDEATEVVSEWLRKAGSPPPTVLLKRQVGNYWIIDLFVTVDGARVSVVSMLKDKELILN